MGKLALRILLGMFLAIFVFGVSGYAEEEEDPEGKLPANLDKLTEKDIKDLARTAFVFKDKNNKEWLFIRLTVQQVARLKLQLKRHGIFRVILHPRQRLAIKQALKLEQIMAKVIVRVSAKRMHAAKGVKHRYIIRAVDQFTKKLLKDGYDEEKEPTEEPSEGVIEEAIKDAGAVAEEK